MFGTMSNSTRLYSPVVLNNEWPKIGRLMFLVLASTIGITMNGFFVASFFIEDTLCRKGLVFMACTGFADFIITTSIMPTGSVLLLAGEWDIDPVCYALQVLTEASTYAYSVFFMMSAIETYYRICKATVDYEAFLSRWLSLQSFIIFLICFATASAGVVYQLDYDYCHRGHTGNFIFRTTTSVLFHGVPFIVTLYCFLRSSCRIRDKASRHANYRRSALYEHDYMTNNLNIAAYLLFVISWIPYLVIVHQYPDATDAQYYHSAWIGVGRSVVTSFLYGFIDICFRNAFAHLFNYCCCKSTLSGPFANRHRRALGQECGKNCEVRVHIMHQAVNANSPQRGASTSRETQDL